MPEPATTPGSYIRSCRIAAGLSVADVAAAVSTEPRIAEHLRAEWIELIEQDVMAPTFVTVAALRCAFAFDLEQLESLTMLELLGPDDRRQRCPTTAHVDAIHAAAGAAQPSVAA